MEKKEFQMLKQGREIKASISKLFESSFFNISTEKVYISLQSNLFVSCKRQDPTEKFMLCDRNNRTVFVCFLTDH